MRVREPGFRLVLLPLMPETAGVDDADLDRVLIGGRERRDIVIADYVASWPRRFEVERNRIAGALGSRALRIEHIGSTAVPGLAAKPIVDILVDVARLEDADLARAGYVLRVREDDHRMFRTPELDVHVHVWPTGHPDIAAQLAFRDRLRTSPELISGSPSLRHICSAPGTSSRGG